MSSHNNQEQELGKVDEAVLRSELWVEKHLKTILIGAGAVLLVGGGLFAYNKLVREPKAEEASAQMYTAEDYFLAGQDSTALKGAGLTAKGFEAIASEYSGTDAGNLALAYSGIALYEQGKYAEALDKLKAFSTKESYVAPSIKRLMGDCLVELGKLEEAAKAFVEAANEANNEAISPSCLIKAGHVYEKLGKKDEALKQYQFIKDKYYTAPEAETVEADIIRASAK